MKSCRIFPVLWDWALPIPLLDSKRYWKQPAASSIALNLSEGSGRATPRDRRRFFQMAFGSIREVQSITQLEPESFNEEERDALDHLAASTYKLIRMYLS